MSGAREVRVVSARLALGCVVVVAVLVGGISAFAGTVDDPFTDVGDGHPFETEIERVAGAGIAGGYTDGTYRPGAPLTRQAMAAFLNRGLGRIASSDGEVVSGLDGAVVDVTSTELHVGAAGGSETRGFVWADVDVFFEQNSDICPCSADIVLTVSGSTRQHSITIPGGGIREAMSTSLVVPHAATEDDGVVTATVQAVPFVTTQGITRSAIEAEVTLAYFPFGYDGGNSLGS